VVGDFFAGVGLFLRGVRLYGRSPRSMVLGVLPALITFALLLAGFVWLLFRADNIAEWFTSNTILRILIAFAVIGLWVVLSVVLFAALTLLIGQPFYEAISKHVEDEVGGLPGGIDIPFWRTLPRAVVESIRLLGMTASIAVVVFLVGLVPVFGQVAGGILGALLGGWGLAVELTSVPFERRGLKLRDRRRMLHSKRSMSLGFGVAAFVCFLTGIGAVLLMPAAIAGATLLSRRLFDQPVEVRSAAPIR
jgi:CysZ protein